MIPFGYCLDGDVLALDYQSKSLPVYRVEMVAMVDEDRTESDPFCIRLSDSLPEFLDRAGHGDGPEGGAVFDFYAALEQCGNRYPMPECRPPIAAKFCRRDDPPATS